MAKPIEPQIVTPEHIEAGIKAAVPIVKWSSIGGILFIILMLAGIPIYRVWSEGLRGQAELARAEHNKRIRIVEAEAAAESADALARAEVIRARGVAEANKIIGDSLKNNEAYLRWLFVQSLADNNCGNVIYIPTEAGLPILEAGQRK